VATWLIVLVLALVVGVIGVSTDTPGLLVLAGVLAVVSVALGAGGAVIRARGSRD
jgi:hypothetical protein